MRATLILAALLWVGLTGDARAAEAAAPDAPAGAIQQVTDATTGATPGGAYEATEDPIWVGMAAYDFSLLRFEHVDVDDPAKAQQAERVTLSSFRGKSPVLLLLSSYT